MTRPTASTPSPGTEHHRSHRSGWLRAGVLGANDGIVSTAALLIGVAAADVGRSQMLTTGFAAVVAGAMSMAAGEYISVSTQRDSERADLRLEVEALSAHPDSEERELAAIYETRGLSPDLARAVARELHEHDAIAAHARDELGFSAVSAARPSQAAATSAVAFVLGALLPVLAVAAAPRSSAIAIIAAAALVALAGLGIVGARVGGAPWVPATARVVGWSAAAMVATYLIGRIAGATF